VARHDLPDDVIVCAADAARRYWIGTLAFRASVVAGSVGEETFRRALHTVVSRKVVLRLETCNASDRGQVRPAPVPALIDPWSVDPARIEAETRVVATCPACDGTRRVECTACQGSGRVRCQGCGGSRQVPGQRGPKACPTCRGRGDQKCDRCKAGRVACISCGTGGLVGAWLAIDERSQQQVRVAPRNAAASIHTNVDAPEDFDVEPDRWPNELVADALLADVSSLPGALQPATDSRSDRVTSTRIQAFRSPVWRVTFRTRLGTGVVEVAGRPLAVAATSNWRPLALRRGLLAGTGAVVVGSMVLMVAGNYLAALRRQNQAEEREHERLDAVQALDQRSQLQQAADAARRQALVVRAQAEEQLLRAAAERRLAADAAQEQRARFDRLSEAEHLAAARASLAEGYDVDRRIGGNLDDAERHLRAVTSDSGSAVDSLLAEIWRRRGRALLPEHDYVNVSCAEAVRMAWASAAHFNTRLEGHWAHWVVRGGTANYYPGGMQFSCSASGAQRGDFDGEVRVDYRGRFGGAGPRQAASGQYHFLQATYSGHDIELVGRIHYYGPFRYGLLVLEEGSILRVADGRSLRGEATTR